MKFSVIIPALNEEKNIAGCISGIRAIDPSVEIVVVDGGSADATVLLAEQSGAIVCRSQPGRGIQCNAGAKVASGEILLFLHADTILPHNAFETLRSYFQNKDIQIGTFRLKFDEQHWLLKFYSYFTRFDSIFSRFGDQCIVVRKPFFDGLGGFPDWKIFEDVKILEEARKQTTIVSFPFPVTSSARRFLKNGIIRQQLINGWLILRYMMGVPYIKIEELYRQYALSETPAIIVFAKYPHPGKVKERLASTFGAERAAELYSLLAEKIFSEVVSLSQRYSRYLLVSGPDDVNKMDSWSKGQFNVQPQEGNDLGERMKNAFHTIFQVQHTSVLLIGSDIPDLSASILEQASASLNSCDVVIGPAQDGGYYLIGMNRHHPEIFSNIHWSTNTVLETTIGNIGRLKLSYVLLPVLIDIDTESDYHLWSQKVFDDPSHPLYGALLQFEQNDKQRKSGSAGYSGIEKLQTQPQLR